MILEAQPEGPYRLCGYCIGGIVAFEIARMLIAAGKDVEMVFMIDPPTINARKSSAMAFFGHEACTAVPRRCRRSRDGVDMVSMRGCSEILQCVVTRQWAAIRKIVRTGGDLRSNHEIDTALALGALPSARNVEPSPLGRFADPGSVDLCRRYVELSSEAPCRSGRLPLGGLRNGSWRRITPDIEGFKLPGTHYHLDFPRNCRCVEYTSRCRGLTIFQGTDGAISPSHNGL